MRFLLTVDSKVETLHQNSEVRYLFHCSLVFHANDKTEGSGEPLRMALHVPKDFWDGIDVGDVLAFLYDTVIEERAG